VRERPKQQPRLKWPGADKSVAEVGESYAQQEINFPTPLNENMLCAECLNIKGDFKYDPPVGRVLSAGTHTLNAYFNPRDTTKCLFGVIQSSITVRKARVVLAWTPEEPTLFFGAPLGLRQLNAKTVDDVEGSFVYR
jgi:hypothetical protein